MTTAFHHGTYRDERDGRDRRFRPKPGQLPPHVDLSPDCGPVFNQRKLQSCSANAIASALMLLANRGERPMPRPSRLFMYYNARALTGDQGSDCGTTVRNAIKAVARYGACREAHWPYRVKDVLRKPLRECYRKAEVRTIVYERISRNLEHLRACLALGDPFVFGIEFYPERFRQAQKTGVLALPAAREQSNGGHALIAVGYDLRRRAFLARTSFGPRYARDGFFWVRDGYFTDRARSFDFWRIRSFAD